MDWLPTLLGSILVLAGLRDIFHTLWHPRGFGSLCRLLFVVLWRATRVVNAKTSRSTELAGPLGILVTVVVWTSLIALGWALIYLPRMPEGFHFGSPLDPAESSGPVGALYLSLVAVATLGFGDIVPADPVLRLLLPLQALVGFVILTAAISWILQVYPALTRRRALARRLSLLAETGATGVVSNGEPAVAIQILEPVTASLTTVEMDLTQYGETYYFRESEPELSLAATLPLVLDLARAGDDSASSEVRHAAGLLARAAARIADRLRRDHGCDGESPIEVFASFASDHQQPTRRPRS